MQYQRSAYNLEGMQALYCRFILISTHLLCLSIVPEPAGGSVMNN